MKKILSFIIAIVLIMSLCSCDTVSRKYPEQIELVNYIGEDLSVVESDLSIELKDMTQYFDNTYRFEAGETLVDFAIDESRKIARIHLRDSGELGYTLLGLTTQMDDRTAAEILIKSGALYVSGTIWQCACKTDSITREDSGWIYEANSETLQEEILIAKMKASITPLHEDSAGLYYLGNHQFVEFYYGYFSDFMYQLPKLTDYQQKELGKEISGRYIAAYGEVVSVSADGVISISCEMTDEAREAEDEVLEITYLADISVVSEQQYLLSSISTGDLVFAFGRVGEDIGDSLLSGSLTDAIVVSINKSSVNPKIEHNIPGVYCFDELGTPIIYSDACDENEITKKEAASALRDVLLSHTQFHYMNEIDDGYKEYITSIFSICGSEFSWPLTPVRFAIVDLDQDGISEVVVEMTNDVDGYELVLHYYNGTVYGYGYGFRSMQSIHTNGVIFASSGAANSYAYMFRFDGIRIKEVEANTPSAGEHVQWYDFTLTNIDTSLGNNDG